MNDLAFDNLGWLHLLWVVLSLAAVGALGIWGRQRALQRFAALPLLSRLVPGTGWVRPAVRLGIVLTALTALVAALIGPRWGAGQHTVFRRNVDVLILLDVSRSMLARDLAPNRLERAKLAIREDLLPALGGDRIGLLAFAGVPSIACPLTTDYGFFRLALDDVTTQSSPRGGTLIGDALRRAATVFDDKLDTHKLIILITDGEDQESYPVEAARGVWEDLKVPIIALALGDPEQGARIPIRDNSGETFLRHDGQTVWSKADFSTLEKTTQVSPQGVFIPVGTKNFRLDDIYERVVARMRFDEQQQRQHVEQPLRAHPFAIAALALILLDSCLRDGPRRPPDTAAARAAQSAAA